MIASAPDLLRLLVLPVFAWAAWRDIETRRIPNRLWPPLAVGGLCLLLWEAARFAPFEAVAGRLFVFQVALSLGLVAPLGYLFWRLGGFGGADAKALIVVAVLLPTFPAYRLGESVVPAVPSVAGVFSFTVLTNTVIFAAAVPLALAASNLARGRLTTAGLFARPVAVDSLSQRHGRLFETPGGFTTRGLDLDALRMYLRWRGTTLSALRAAPDAHRDPASLGGRFDPTDGAVRDGPRTDGDVAVVGKSAPTPVGASASTPATVDDDWGAAAFLDEIDGSAYGTTPAVLRESLELLADADRATVWVSPGMPFLVPMFAGLLVAFAYGDLLFGLLGRLGLF
ncbi:prepilin peptidase [Haloferacaceae archaeon DSL9]